MALPGAQTLTTPCSFTALEDFVNHTASVIEQGAEAGVASTVTSTNSTLVVTPAAPPATDYTQ